MGKMRPAVDSSVAVFSGRGHVVDVRAKVLADISTAFVGLSYQKSQWPYRYHSHPCHHSNFGPNPFAQDMFADTFLKATDGSLVLIFDDLDRQRTKEKHSS